MDPAIGASTCALGSQRWKKYKGILTKNARIETVHQRRSKKLEWNGEEYENIRKDRV
jgi:hypothetical protein